MRPLPLRGVRVIEMGQIFSVPYAGALLADLGAEVIKLEGPGRVDSTRGTVAGAYADNEPGIDRWNRRSNFNLLNRGKKSLVLDLKDAAGLHILKQLVARSDVLMENFSPRVTKSLGLEYEDLRKLNPAIIMVSNSGYGRGTGPYANYPAQATTQEATHGLAHVTGYPGDIPSKAGGAYVDYLACWGCTMGVALALRHRKRTGVGQHVDVGMYQLGCFNVSDFVLDWLSNGRIGERIGNRHPYHAPQGCYPCAGEDAWCTLSVRTDDEWLRLCRVIGRDDLATIPALRTHAGRHAHHDEIDAAICQWSRQRAKREVVQKLQENGIPAGAVLDVAELHIDPHSRARGIVERQEFPASRGMGARMIVKRPWTFRHTPHRKAYAGPAFGEHNREILMEVLGFDSAQCDALEEKRVIASRPTTPAQDMDEKDMARRVSLGEYARYDADYRERLGLPSA